jgi:hypothetical protein
MMLNQEQAHSHFDPRNLLAPAGKFELSSTANGKESSIVCRWRLKNRHTQKFGGKTLKKRKIFL